MPADTQAHVALQAMEDAILPPGSLWDLQTLVRRTPIGHDIGCVEADAIRMWRSNNDIEQRLQTQVPHYGRPRKANL
ncbi:g8919 [Coccomyxa viridis]|uniref:G8919 protein n=1 Tax=Coccomyxa viridis TaxID=1274662 RepID=A0ABP1G2T4_9CHLO